jgi:hypothetical protein
MHTIHLFYYRGQKRTPFTDLHYASIVTAKEKGGFDKIVVHEDCPGDSNYYTEARKLPYVEWRKTEYDSSINQDSAIHEKRMQILFQEGGVVADLNFIFLCSFKPLLHQCFFSKQKKKIGKILYAPRPNMIFQNDEKNALPVKIFYPVSSSNKTFLQGADITLSESYAIYIWGNVHLKDLQKTTISSYLPILSPMRFSNTILSFD